MHSKYWLILNRNYLAQEDALNDATQLVKKIGYPVSRFDIKGSQSEGLVYFDASNQSYFECISRW